MTKPRDPYEVLGVPHEATHAEITTAYRVLLRRLHPDTRDQPADPARLAEVLAAYAVLRDPERRASYDADHARDDAGRDAGDEAGRGGHPAPPAAEPRPVRVRTGPRARRRPDIWVGPVRRHRS